MKFLVFALLLFAACNSSNKQEATDSVSYSQLKSKDSTKATRHTPEGTLHLLYEAVNRHDYQTAYNMWERNDSSNASGKTFEDFVKGYRQTKTAEIIFTGKTVTEGAAGSIYATVPARVDAVEVSGAQQTFVGEYVLRKSNVEPGSDTLPWHIESAHFKLLVTP